MTKLRRRSENPTKKQFQLIRKQHIHLFEQLWLYGAVCVGIASSNTGFSITLRYPASDWQVHNKGSSWAERAGLIWRGKPVRSELWHQHPPMALSPKTVALNAQGQ
ncbi:hypothetical protein AOLI_G00229400 [Acnodon oligacanthus]